MDILLRTNRIMEHFVEKYGFGNCAATIIFLPITPNLRNRENHRLEQLDKRPKSDDLLASVLVRDKSS